MSRDRDRDRENIAKRMSMIGRTVLVMSGKGGVGKSTVAVNLAVSLAGAGKKVGLLDIDIHGPSVPKLLGMERFTVHGNEDSLFPLEVGDNLRVMSIGFLLRESGDAVIWRGPMKYGVITQFLGNVEWGALDYLVVDSPPGTGDEPLTIAQLITDARGAVIVTTPQDVALIDVRKCIDFCRQLSIPVIGVVENMSGFRCPHCGGRTEIFKAGGGRKLAEETGIPFLGSVPIDPEIVASCDEGLPQVVNDSATETGMVFGALAAGVQGFGGWVEGAGGAAHEAGRDSRLDKKRIAIPVEGDRLCMHFGHCEKFAMIDVAAGRIVQREYIDAPAHQPGLLPGWLGERGADLVIAGGIGSRARSLFEEKGIEVVAGAPCEPPDRIVLSYIAGELELGENTCDH